MARHVVVGAGSVGSTTALLLAEAGHDVVVVTRSGSGPAHPRIDRVAADAGDPVALGAAAAGAAALYNCANPKYHRWATDWPPIASALIEAAAATGAVLVTTSNLYGYGPVDHPMVESDPLAASGTKGRIRAAMWTEALDAHRAGRIRATEARASDFFGPGLTATSYLGERMIPPLLAGKTVRVLGDPDAPHSWTYVPDVARALVVLGTDERAWGRPWHVPTNPARSLRQITDALAAAAGVQRPKLARIPRWATRTAALVWPLLRELAEIDYQFDRPFVLDSTAFTATFGLQATPMDEALRQTLDWWRRNESRAA